MDIELDFEYLPPGGAGKAWRRAIDAMAGEEMHEAGVHGLYGWALLYTTAGRVTWASGNWGRYRPGHMGFGQFQENVLRPPGYKGWPGLRRLMLKNARGARLRRKVNRLP